VDIETVDTTVGKDVKPEYLAINPLGQVPTFVGANGFTLSETIAITVFCRSFQKTCSVKRSC
jgi:elongation factor 1-gamma